MATSLDLGWVVGPLLGLGIFLAEGRSTAQKPPLAAGSPDDAIWNSTFWLNRLLLAVLGGTFFTVLLVYSARHWSLINAIGSFACGCLAWILVFLGTTYPKATERYRDLVRFEQLRYGYKVPTSRFIVPGAFLALIWLAYVGLHV